MDDYGSILVGLAGNLLAALVYSFVALWVSTRIPYRYHPASRQLRRVYERNIRKVLQVDRRTSMAIVRSEPVRRQLARPVFDPVREEKLIERVYIECCGPVPADFRARVQRLFQHVADEISETAYYRDRASHMLARLLTFSSTATADGDLEGEP